MRKKLLMKSYKRRSNGSLLDLDCSDLTGWADGDTGEAVSDQTTFDGRSVFRFDTNTSEDTNDSAIRSKDVGSVNGLGTRVTVSVRVYFDLLGTLANVDLLNFQVQRSDWAFEARFATDGAFVYDGASYNEAGTNIVALDVWQEYTFDIDLSGGIAAATCDVYLNRVLKASGVDCSNVGANTDGNVYMQLAGHATDNLIAYIDWIKIGDKLI